MNQLHLQNDEQNQNAYAPPQNAALANSSIVGQQTGTAQVHAPLYAATPQNKLKPEYVTLLLGEIKKLVKKRILLRRAAHGLALGAFVSLACGYSNTVASMVANIKLYNDSINEMRSAAMRGSVGDVRAWRFPFRQSQEDNNYIAEMQSYHLPPYRYGYEAWRSTPPPPFPTFSREITDRLAPLHSDFTGNWSLGTLFCYATTGSIACYFFARKARRERNKRIQAVAEMNDAQIIGSLLEASQAGKSGIHKTARTALLKLLPALRASDSAALSVMDKQNMARTLNFNDAELTLAILKALEQVGDASAIPAVQKMAKGRGDVSRDWQIMESARQCLPFLEQSAENRQAAAQLLRPAAYTANATDAQQLLRATPNEEV